MEFVRSCHMFLIWLFFVFLLCGLYACAQEASTDPGDDARVEAHNPPSDQNKPLRIGQQEYEEQCAICHGIDGGGSSLYTGLKRSFSVEELEFIISVSMPPTHPNTCTKKCAQDVADYVYTSFASEMAQTAAILNVPPSGATLYQSGCAACHGIDGQGNGGMIGVSRNLSVSDLTTIIETRMPPANPGTCVGECATLTADYIYNNFTTTLLTIPTPPAAISIGADFYATQCASCHGVDGLGVGTIIGLTRDISLSVLEAIIRNTMPVGNPTACTGSCASETAQYIYDNFRVPNNTIVLPSATAGETIYLQQCANCHGLDGRGVGVNPGVTRYLSQFKIRQITSATMPPANPADCVGLSCAAEVAQYIFDNFTLPPPPPIVPVTPPPPPPPSAGTPTSPSPPPANTGTTQGQVLYSSQGCAGCHGINGQGIGVVVGVTRNMTQSQLTAIIESTMPPSNPTLCAGSCASQIAGYIFNNFTDPNAATITDDPLATLPKGSQQTGIACARMAQSGENNVIRDLFCGATPPRITGLRDLQTGLGLAFNSNNRRGNPQFAITGHSSSLVAKFVNAINPRAVIFSRPGPGFITIGFARGDQFVEVITGDRATGALQFFLVAFEIACNATHSCTNGDVLTPAIETGWTNVTLYGEEDLKNTVIDCRHCHQLNGPGTEKILRMQELREPWNHWFSDERGGRALVADFQAAHGTNEDFAGIPAGLVPASDPENLEDFVIANGFRNQPNEFVSEDIESEVNQTPGQPQDNSRPGVSPTWNVLYNRSKQGLAIPPPYHDVKVTDPAKLATLTQAYRSYLNGSLAPATLPDLRDAFLQSRLFEIGFAVEPGLDGRGILLQACSQCHNSRLDQTISRAKFNVDLNAMSNLSGGRLTGAARDQEIGIVINRIQLPKDDIRIMPPSHTFRVLKPDEIQRVIAYLCTQVSTQIAQCR